MSLKDRLRQTAASLPEVKLAVLFGSTARGKAGPRSDVDIGVLLEPDTPESRSRVEVELGRAVGDQSVHLVFLTEEDAPPLLRFEIARDGVVLRQDKDGLWTDFKAQAMIDWWDWEPYHRMFTEAATRREREDGQY